MKRAFNIILLMTFLSSLVIAMEQKPELVKIQIEDKMYELTLKQAQQSEKLQEILKKHTDVEEPIIFPYSIAPEVFDYIYKDLQGIEFDSSLLDDKMIGDLYNASVDLKIPWLQEKYTDITVDRITDITLEVGDKKYHLTAEQAKRSKTLKNTLSDVEDYTVPIPLPDALENVFEYIYDDLTHKEYDSDVLNIETLVDLVNAANYLDALQLLQRYQNLLIERLTYVDEKNFEEYINLLQKLPEEMQEPLSQLICAKALKVFKKLPQSKMKLIPDIEYIFNFNKVSPDKTKIVLQKDKRLQLIDLINNKILWQIESKRQGQIFDTILFSLDSLKVLVSYGSTVQVFNANDGKELLHKNFSSVISSFGFSADGNKILLKESFEKILVLNIDSGKVSFEREFNEDAIDNCYYDSESQMICLKLSKFEFGDFLNVILVIDIKTGATIKERTSTESYTYDISPDGKKIIYLSKELVRVENSFDEKGNFSWKFKKPLATIPKITSFSNNGTFFAVSSGENSVAIGFVLNNATGEILWASSNREVRSTFFSPDDRLFVLKKANSISCINLDLKKETWTKKYLKEIQELHFISNDYLMIFFNNNIAFCSILTGEIVSEISLKKGRFFGNVLKDNIFLSSILQPRHMKCYDISFLHIFTFLNRSYVPLDQALFMYYSIIMIANDFKIQIFSSNLETIYNELPPEVKLFIENYNKQFIETEKT